MSAMADYAIWLEENQRTDSPDSRSDYARESAQESACQRPNPLFFLPDGTFKSPEMAAAHACLVQGGYSTPVREARRMVKDGGPAGDRARRWLEDHGEDLPEPAGHVYASVDGDAAIRVCLTHDPDFGLYGTESCAGDVS
jgi:hypothetical protein